MKKETNERISDRSVGGRDIDQRQIFLIGLGIVLLLLLCVVGVTDETKDDFSIQTYTTDVDGISTYYHMWATVPRIVAVYFLQRIFPAFAWNYLLQVILIFAAILIICDQILRKLRGSYGFIAALMTAVLLFFQTISSMNYTRTASLVMCAGACLIFGGNGKGRRLCGYACFVLGSILRFKLICMTFGFLAILCAWSFWKTKGKLKRRIGIVWRQDIFPLGVMLALVMLIELAGNTYIQGIPTWKTLRDRNALSERLLDYPLKAYEDAREEYAALGITENDCRMIQTRMSNSDSEYFTNHMYQTLIHDFSERWEMERFSCEVIKGWIMELLQYLRSGIFGWFVLCAILLSLCAVKREAVWLPVLTCLCLLAYLLFFCFMGRVVDRISFGVYLWSGMVLLNCIGRDELSDRYRAGLQRLRENQGLKRLLLLFLIAGTCCMAAAYRRTIDTDAARVFDYIENDKDHFYFYTKISECRAVRHLLLTKDYWDTQNSFYSSEFDVSVHDSAKLRKYGIRNIYRDAVDSEVIRIIDSDRIGQIERYIQEHYCGNARAVLEGEISGYQVYQIVSSKRQRGN